METAKQKPAFATILSSPAIAAPQDGLSSFSLARIWDSKPLDKRPAIAYHFS